MRRKMKNLPVFPFDECRECQSIKDCPHPEVELDGLGSPIPPDDCPRFTDIMKTIVEQQRLLHELIRRN